MRLNKARGTEYLEMLGDVGDRHLGLFRQRLDVTRALSEKVQNFQPPIGSQLRPALAYYSRTDPGHSLGSVNRIRVCHLNRTESLEEMLHSFQTEAAELPRDARSLGGRVRDGLGEYYRQMMAPTRQLEENAAGNWVARYANNGKADHFAHAENYCRVAAKIRRRPVKFIGGSIGTNPQSNKPPRTWTRR